MFLIFDKQSRDLVDWQESYPSNKQPSDHPIVYEDNVRIVLEAPNWQPGRISFKDGIRYPENDRFLNQNNQIRTASVNRKRNRLINHQKKSIRNKFNNDLGSKLQKRSRLPLAYILEMGNLALALKQ